MLEIKNLKVSVWKKEILRWINLKFELWKNYLLLWRNGSWKSSLANFLMGNPNYEWQEGSVEIQIPISHKEQNKDQFSSSLLKWNKDQNSSFWDKKQEKVFNDFLLLTPDQRSKLWLFLSFQSIPEIEWIKLWEFLRIVYNIHLKNKNPTARDISPFIFRKYIWKHLEELNIAENFLERDLNVGFSGWEKRKIEILQMKLIEPKYIILDEIDSGLDVDAFKIIAKTIKEMSSKNNTFIIITHQFKILDYLKVDKIFVMEKGKIVEKWGKEIIEKIYKEWFE